MCLKCSDIMQIRHICLTVNTGGIFCLLVYQIIRFVRKEVQVTVFHLSSKNSLTQNTRYTLVKYSRIILQPGCHLALPLSFQSYIDPLQTSDTSSGSEPFCELFLCSPLTLDLDSCLCSGSWIWKFDLIVHWKAKLTIHVDQADKSQRGIDAEVYNLQIKTIYSGRPLLQYTNLNE